MTKKSKKEKPEVVKEFEITGGTIKDDFCDYRYEVKSGVNKGDSHNVTGSGIIEEDLREAFAKFNVHLAVIDDVFKHSGEEISDIDKMHSNELATLYSVTGFKMHGSDENLSIVLIGTKHIGASGERMKLVTPRIPIDKLASYEWKNELKEAAENACLEVELYKGGKCTPVQETDKVNANQLTIASGMDDDFEKGKV